MLWEQFPHPSRFIACASNVNPYTCPHPVPLSVLTLEEPASYRVVAEKTKYQCHDLNWPFLSDVVRLFLRTEVLTV